MSRCHRCLQPVVASYISSGSSSGGSGGESTPEHPLLRPARVIPWPQSQRYAACLSALAQCKVANHMASLPCRELVQGGQQLSRCRSSMHAQVT